MKKILFISFLLMLTAGWVEAQTKEAVIEVKKTMHDFGKINEKDGPVTAEFTVKNTGTSPLVITRVVASCGCTSLDWSKEPIAPGATTVIKITYDPKNRPGPFTKPVSVYSNGKKGSLVLNVKGEVIR